MGSLTVGESPQLGLIQSYLMTNWVGVQSTIEKTIPGVSYCKLYPTKNTNKFGGPNPREPKGFWRKCHHSSLKALKKNVTKIGFETLRHWK